MSEAVPAGRKIAARLLTTSTLLLLIVVVALDHGRLLRLERSLRESDRAANLASVSSQYAAIASDVEALKNAPPAASEAEVNAFKSEWDARLSGLEEATTAHGLDLIALNERLDVLERRRARATRQSPAAGAPVPTAGATGTANPTPSVAAPLDPPFLPLSIELRGGEQFLLIVPEDASSIAQARALRLGDREGAWTLERLERNAAEFRVEGQLRRLNVPR